MFCGNNAALRVLASNFFYLLLSSSIFYASFACKNKRKMINKEKIRTLLEEALPLVDFDSDFLFSELDSLGVTTILMILSKEYNIELESRDATPKNFKTLDSLVALCEAKLSARQSR
jgi:acyl carrier protein